MEEPMPDPSVPPPDQPVVTEEVAKPRPRFWARARARLKRLTVRFLVPTMFVVTTFVVAYFFHQDESANPMSRLMTVMAVVDDHSLRGDRWKDSIADKAVIDGHVYSDKAPFSSFLVVPFYAAWRVFHPNADAALRQQGALHIGNALAATLPFIIVGLLVFAQLRRLGPTRASQVALIAMLSTCLYQYGHTYYGHMLAGCLLLGSYLLAVKKGRPFWAGFLAGLGVTTEYPILLPAAIIGLWLLGPKLSGWRRVLWFGAGAVPPALGLIGYNWALTGHPFSLSYSHVTEAWAPMRLAFGMRLPSPLAIWELVFGQFRGVLFWAPTLGLLIPLALRKPYSTAPEVRREYWLLMVLSVTGLLFVASYFKWDGGWCTGPRHLAPIMTLLLYEGAGRLAGDWRRFRVLFLVLGVVGIFVNLPAAATGPILPEEHKHPLFDKYLPDIANNHINWHNLAHELFRDPNKWWLVPIWVGLFLCALGLLQLAGWTVGRLSRERPAATRS
jgi:hypothetical protein